MKQLASNGRERGRPTASSALKQYRPPATSSDMNFIAVTGFPPK